MYSFHLGITGTLVYKLGIFTLAKLEVLELLKRSEKPNKSRCAITFHLVRSKVTQVRSGLGLTINYGP